MNGRAALREVAVILLSWVVITAVMLVVQVGLWHTPWDQVKWEFSALVLPLLIGSRIGIRRRETRSAAQAKFVERREREQNKN